MRQDLRFGTIAALLLTALVFSALLLSPTALRYGHDVFYHLTRTEALYDQLLRGVWGGPVNYFFFGGAGYASSACYPDTLLYIPAVLRLLGLNPGQACSAFTLCCLAASCGTAYWCARRVTGSRWTGAVAAIIYTLCQYKLDCVYTRGAVGEIQAFIFIPLAMYAVYDLIFQQFRRPALMVLAFGGLMLTHTISLFMAVVIAAVFCLIFWRRVWPHVPQLAGLALLTLGLTAFFWLPCVEMLLTMPLKAAQPWTTAVENAVRPSLLFANVLLGDGKAGLGAALPLLCLPALVLFRRQLPPSVTGAAVEAWEEARHLALISLAAGVLTATAATTVFPWAHAGFLGVIQFPWRLYSFASWFLALGAAGALGCVVALLPAAAAHGRSRHVPLALTLTVLACMCLTAWQHYGILPPRYYELPRDYFADPAESVYIGKEEWMPVTVNRDVLRPDDHRSEDDKGSRLPYTLSADRRVLTLPLDAAARQWVDVPFVWYRGYTAVFTPAQGGAAVPLTVTGAGRNGFCRVLLRAENGQAGSVDAGQPDGLGAGTVRVWYAGTSGQHVAGWLSLASLLAAVWLLWRRGRHERQKA